MQKVAQWEIQVDGATARAGQAEYEVGVGSCSGRCRPPRPGRRGFWWVGMCVLWQGVGAAREREVSASGGMYV